MVVGYRICLVCSSCTAAFSTTGTYTSAKTKDGSRRNTKTRRTCAREATTRTPTTCHYSHFGSQYIRQSDIQVYRCEERRTTIRRRPYGNSNRQAQDSRMGKTGAPRSPTGGYQHIARLGRDILSTSLLLRCVVACWSVLSAEALPIVCVSA